MDLMNIRIKQLIDKLQLEKHPEGGWYKETYRSPCSVDIERGERQLATVIYFMLQGDEKSAFHRLRSDEFWYYHQGSRLNVHVIYEDGKYKLHKLGLIDELNSAPQLFLPAGCWFAAECTEKDSYSLVSCSVHPGFDFADFELANKDDLLAAYPNNAELINKFCIS